MQSRDFVLVPRPDRLLTTGIYSPYVNKSPPGPSRANLEPVGFIIPTFRSNLGVVGFININFLDPQNDRFLAFSPCKTAKRVQKKFRRASRAGEIWDFRGL